VLAAADLAPGKSITLPIFNGQSGSVMNATFKVGALEEVTVPAGKFQAYKVDGAVGPQQMTLWLRQDAPHIAVKQEISGQPISIELQSVE
jgi:hypothetical protein